MDEATGRLCHVTTAEALRGGRLQGQPFLHCCTEAQLPFVLQRHFAGRAGLLVVRFGREQVEGRIEWEQSEPDQAPFPHLFGVLVVSGAEVSAVR